ncbi:SPW_0924 family protein [Streptomyces sp. GC420]|nr:SPW_0924 family protein [Streptomyces sp. GC420]NBM16810.1 SPW_0924 family protein [Streptomyces sp. GC420]
MRALTAAAVGLAAALALVLGLTALASCSSPGETSPEPLLTTVPGPKGR